MQSIYIMTSEQRRAEFLALFNAIPGRNIDRIRKVCTLLFYKENTVRIMLIDPDRKSGGKMMPEAKLRLLRRELEREGIIKAEAQTESAA